jgi:putative ABC transport system permease protein
MSLLRFTIREWINRPGRAVLTILSVVIGVAAVLSVAMVTATTRSAYSQMDESITGRAALEVSAQWAGGFDESLAISLRQAPGIEAVAPLLERSTILYFKGKRVKLPVLGIDPERCLAIGDYKLEEGRFELGQNQGLISAEFARGMGIRLGDEVRILTRRGVKQITISGFLAKEGKLLLQQGILLLDLEDAQEFFVANGRVDKIQLVLRDKASEKVVADQIAKLLPAGLNVCAPTGRVELATETLAIVEQALGFSGILSLVLAVAVIFNTFLMNVSERRHQLGILRAIGATRGQITKMVLVEGVLLGIVGILLGIPMGLIGSHLLMHAMEQLLGKMLPDGQLALGPYLLAATLGLTASLIAAYLPARKASRISPLQAIAGADAEAGETAPGTVRPIPMVGAAALLFSGAMLAAALAGWISIRVMVYSEVVALVGFAMLVPALLLPLTRLVAWVLSPLMKVELRLAWLQIVRRHTRSTLTVAVLLVAMAFVISIGSTAINTISDVKNWSQRMIKGDFYLWATLPDIATATAVGMPEVLRDEIARIDGVANVDTVCYVGGRVGNQAVIVIAGEYTAQDHLPLDLRQGVPGTVRTSLLNGEAVIGTALAERLQVGLNGVLHLNTPRGPQALRVAGIANDYTVGGMTVYLHRATAKRLLDIKGIDVFIIDSQPSTQRQVETALRAYCEEHGLLFQSAADLHSLLDRMMAGFLVGLWVLMVLGFLVASCAVYNTLSMNVLEQTRDLGLLRIVGMTRRQVSKMVLIEALILGVVGLVPGLIIGVVLAILNHASAARLLGHDLEIRISPLWLGGCLALAIMIVLAAAWIPAQRAARLKLTSALQTD